MIHRQWVAALVAALLAAPALAQEWPSKAVRMVVPWGPGGGTDIAARQLGARLTEMYGQQFPIDNRGGANGMIGADLVAKAPGDGYTVMVHTLSSHVLNTSYYSKLPYNPDRDFAPITLVGKVPLALFVHPSFPVKTVRDVVNIARAKPDSVQYASFATGSPSHFAGALLAHMTGTKMLHVPYKGGGLAMAAVLGGEAYLHFGGIAVGLPHVQAGKIRAIAVSTAERTPQLPELPTVAEALNLKDYDVSVTFGMLVAASTPKALQNTIFQKVAAAVNSKEYKERLHKVATDEAPVLKPDELAQWLKAETARWGEIVRSTGIRGD
jgi:tripartite-type tricarboxylate transporter receptor subunit TctC